MSALDDVLRSSVDAHVGAPVDAGALLVGATRTASRRRRRTRAAAVVAVAASVAAVVTGAGVLRADEPDAPAAPVAHPVPAGQQAVSWHGVQVLVPASWRLDALRCTQAAADTVLRPGARLTCLARQAPGLTVVEFSALTPDGRGTPAAAATTPVDLDGVPALRGTVLSYSRYAQPQEVLVVPSEQVVVTVTAPTYDVTRALLDTATVVDVDANGCRSRVAATRATGPAPRSGADASLLPGSPTSVSVCRYAGLRLEESRRLSPGVVRALQTRLEGLPTGRSGRLPVDETSDDACREADAGGLLLDAAYRRGPHVQVWDREQACTDRSPTNGTAVRRVAPLDTYRLLHGDPLELPAARVGPAPELGFAGLPRRQSPPVPAQRADLLARTDDPADGRLLGVRLADGRRCLLLATSEAAPPSLCDLQAGTLETFDDGTGTWAGTTTDVVRSVRVLVDGRQVAVVATYGAGATWAQRRAFLVRLPAGSRPRFVPLDGLGRTVP
ncbi:MAG: hypothetical protein JWN17_746 [Frankiales bacterium]|nr:hypothetical protein [Frankiales bacterium]